jgi:ATP-binding protein involved in chromosome partitioning
MPDKEKVLEVLRGIRFPGVDRDIVSLGYVRSVSWEGDRFRIHLEMATNQPEAAAQVEAEVRRALEGHGIPSELEVTVRNLSGQPAGAPLGLGADLLARVPAKIAIASAKGGVGKSTVAVNLAVALARRGVGVGLLDADIHGPSVPIMMGLGGVQPEVEGETLKPVERYGVHTMSIGLLIETDTAVIWRGPMVGKALEQLMAQVDWSGVQLLLLDLPPGTGDIQITLAQRTALTGGLVVTTPQDVALLDAGRGVAMFRRVQVPVLGIVENMSHFVCPHCGKTTDVFGRGGGRREAERLGVPLLAELPLDPRVAAGGDEGVPVVVADPDGPVSQAFLRLADEVLKTLPQRVRPGASTGSQPPSP